MRDFFIGSFEKLVSLIVVLICVGVLIAAVAAISEGGILAGLAVLIGGAVYAVLMGGMLYLMLGMYHNTKRTAEAVEKLVERS